MAADLPCENRFPAKGSTVEVAPDVTGSPGTYAFVGALIDVTPPPQERATVELTALEDDVACAHPGVEQVSEFVFNEHWDMLHATSALLDGYYNTGELVHFRIAPANGTNRRHITFTGRVRALTPGTASGTGGYGRQVTALRNSTLTYADFPYPP